MSKGFKQAVNVVSPHTRFGPHRNSTGDLIQWKTTTEHPLERKRKRRAKDKVARASRKKNRT